MLYLRNKKIKKKQNVCKAWTRSMLTHANNMQMKIKRLLQLKQSEINFMFATDI